MSAQLIILCIILIGLGLLAYQCVMGGIAGL